MITLIASDLQMFLANNQFACSTDLSAFSLFVCFAEVGYSLLFFALIFKKYPLSFILLLVACLFILILLFYLV